MATKDKEQVDSVKESVASYTKAQLIVAAKYANRKDLIAALLQEDKLYTIAQADTLISKFLKGKVK